MSGMYDFLPPDMKVPKPYDPNTHCQCDSDEHWIPSAMPDRIYTCMLCHRPVAIDTVVVVKKRFLERAPE